MDLKSQLGESSSYFEETITSEKLNVFRSAVQASTEGVPPTYLTRLREGEFELLTRWGVTLDRVLHAEQEYEYLAPLLEGHTLRYRTRFLDLIEKKGNAGILNFLAFELEVSDKRLGTLLARGWTNFVIRGQI